MHTTQFFTLAAMSAAAVMAAPSIVQLRADDVVLYGKGRYQIIKRSDFDELNAFRKNGTVPPMPGYLNPDLTTTGGNTESSNSTNPIQKRATSLIIPGEESRFLGWDVQMSQAVQGAPTTISISTGYSIANSISVGTSTDLTIVKDFLSASFSIDYSQTWTSTETQQFTGEVPKGKFGAFVSNPWTNRKTGNVFKGTVGSEGELTYYQADSFDSKGFGQMEWVDGVISLCVGDAFPLPRCLGEGTL